MIYELKIRFLYFVTFLIKKITISTVNSACWYSFGQEKEPESLQRFKKQR